VPNAGEQGRRLTFHAAEPNERREAQSRTLNENNSFTNSCGEPEEGSQKSEEGIRNCLSAGPRFILTSLF